jgi:hypothetical protein
VNADGSITEREVTVGVMSRGRGVITGLTEGEQVVRASCRLRRRAYRPERQSQQRFPGSFGRRIPGGGFPGGGFPAAAIRDGGP